MRHEIDPKAATRHLRSLTKGVEVKGYLQELEKSQTDRETCFRSDFRLDLRRFSRVFGLISRVFGLISVIPGPFWVPTALDSKRMCVLRCQEPNIFHYSAAIGAYEWPEAS